MKFNFRVKAKKNLHDSPTPDDWKKVFAHAQPSLKWLVATDRVNDHPLTYLLLALNNAPSQRIAREDSRLASIMRIASNSFIKNETYQFGSTPELYANASSSQRVNEISKEFTELLKTEPGLKPGPLLIIRRSFRTIQLDDQC